MYIILVLHLAILCVVELTESDSTHPLCLKRPKHSKIIMKLEFNIILDSKHCEKAMDLKLFF